MRQLPSQSQRNNAQEDEDYVNSECSLSEDSLAKAEADKETELADKINPAKFGNTVISSVCSYKDMYVCDGKVGSKGPFLPCNRKGCCNMFHFGCIEFHLEGMEGIDESNKGDYSARKQLLKRRGCQVVNVQEIEPTSVKRWQMDQK
eukprot:10836985-Ditylum_brightwellii.AAC.1